MLENIRMSAEERRALMYAVKDVEEEVYFFGSRLSPHKKGGDIDILIFSSKNSLDLSRKIARQFFLECEEKIDVIVCDRDNLTNEQKAFINTLKLVRIK